MRSPCYVCSLMTIYPISIITDLSLIGTIEIVWENEYLGSQRWIFQHCCHIIIIIITWICLTLFVRTFYDIMFIICMSLFYCFFSLHRLVNWSLWSNGVDCILDWVSLLEPVSDIFNPHGSFPPTLCSTSDLVSGFSLVSFCSPFIYSLQLLSSLSPFLIAVSSSRSPFVFATFASSLPFTLCYPCSPFSQFWYDSHWKASIFLQHSSISLIPLSYIPSSLFPCSLSSSVLLLA